jgi:hypothetical protein
MGWEARGKTLLIFLIIFVPMCFFLNKNEWPILLFWGVFSWLITWVLID